MSLELTIGGYMMGGPDAVALFESVAELIPEEIRTEEFCELYERALNRIRWLVVHDMPIPVRKRKGKHFTEELCGKCAFGVNEPSYKYCPRCGREIKR